MNRFKDYIDAHIKEYPTARYRENEPMSEYTSFRIGGAVPVMFLPDSEGELVSLIRTASRLGIKPLVIGKGTNLLVCDGELSVPVIQTAGLNAVTVFENGELECACGAVLASSATAAMKAGLSGLEFAHGIPGSVGGAVLMNAGAYGGEMKDVVTSVRAICADGDVREFSREDCDFSYRHSRFSDADCVILSAKLKLCAGDVNEIKARMEELSHRRRASTGRRICSGAYRRGGAQGLFDRRSAGVRKARGLCGEQRRRDVRRRLPDYRAYTKNGLRGVRHRA